MKSILADVCVLGLCLALFVLVAWWLVHHHPDLIQQFPNTTTTTLVIPLRRVGQRFDGNQKVRSHHERSTPRRVVAGDHVARPRGGPPTG